ncbi:MAG: hypothetical protein SFY81_02510 [Verrucomicrobiota bacterium]|nr:hypothetical protein [Verrucomicrobiota bacterium]
MKTNFLRRADSMRCPGFCKGFLLLALLLVCGPASRAQWSSQSITLQPGWNAAYLHIDATHDTLENLVGAASPIAEIWVWQPSTLTGRIINNPQQPVSGNDWMQWTKLTGPANAFPLRANTAYLIRNSGVTPFVWTLKGKPVPPQSQWAASGLNFFGFSTRADSPPLFGNFLQPAQSASPFSIFYFPGGEGAGAPPNAAPLFSLNSVPVARGQAVWIRKQDNSDNRYFGPFDISLQDYRGIVFSDTLGTYSLRLRNQLAQTNRITATLIESEATPGGQTIPTAPLLLRTTRDITTLTYAHTNLAANQPRTFVLAPKGQPGSELEVVIGLDRASMSGTNGTLYAAILRLQDTTLGHMQIDLPVTAKQSSREGLWVGSAAIRQVGNYLKTYARATNEADFNAQLPQLTALNEANKAVSLLPGAWTPHAFSAADPQSVGANQAWTALASSADGTNLVAAVNGGKLYTSQDRGTTWTARDSDRDWKGVASSSNGTNLVAIVSGGQIYTSTDAGATWTPRDSDRDWISVASSADGTNLVAAVENGKIYTSIDAGLTWTERDSDRLWSSVASSADGTNLVAAVSGGKLYTSTNAGAAWMERDQDRDWVSVASSANGTNLIAAVSGGKLYISLSAGVDWSEAESERDWASVGTSASGTNLIAAVRNGQLYTSSNLGVTWIPRESNRAWGPVASSSDGVNLLAAVDGGRLFSSSDAGVHWNVAAPELWSCVASSADGANLAAAGNGSQIYTSSDYGVTWEAQTNSPLANWRALASSADGSRLVAAAYGGSLYSSGDFGVHWTPRMPNANWQSVAASDDGLKMVAVVYEGNIFTSVDAGEHWTERVPISNQKWQAVASSADGTMLVAAIQGDQIYRSTNSGVAWVPLYGSPTAAWQSIASSADGKNLVAVANPGGVYTSTDFGTTWDLKASAPPGGRWASVASSTNGNALVAVEQGGRIYTSSNAGSSWTPRESIRGWSAVASSADGTRLLAAESGGASQLYTQMGDLVTPSLVFDTNSNLVLSGGSKYLTASFDTALGDVPTPFPLRLIVHRADNGITKLLQHVFVGPDAVTSNSIITLDESNLHPGMLSQARRITAVHLPISNDGWQLKGEFGGLGIMNAVLVNGFNDHASNPFIHSYHPDHDNLDALFQPITQPGAESYEIKRQITLSFTPPGDDFASRTIGFSRLQGTYLENIVLKGSDSQIRTIVTKGDFLLTRVSGIATIK